MVPRAQKGLHLAAAASPGWHCACAAACTSSKLHHCQGPSQHAELQTADRCVTLSCGVAAHGECGTDQDEPSCTSAAGQCMNALQSCTALCKQGGQGPHPDCASVEGLLAATSIRSLAASLLKGELAVARPAASMRALGEAFISPRSALGSLFVVPACSASSPSTSSRTCYSEIL